MKPTRTNSYLSMHKLTGQTIVLSAARHNLRAIAAERRPDGRIDASRSHHNEILAGPDSARQVYEHSKSRMAEAGITSLRRDAVRCLELLMSLPSGHHAANSEFFADCVKWAANRYGGENILSAVVHRDEAAPHLHVLILPLVNGKMNGSALMGGLGTLGHMHRSFHQVVGSKYGLRDPSKRQSAKERNQSYRAVVEHLRLTHDPVLTSELFPWVLDHIRREPQVCLDLLGVDVKKEMKKSRTMAQIFTSKGKGARFEKDATGAVRR